MITFCDMSNLAYYIFIVRECGDNHIYVIMTVSTSCWKGIKLNSFLYCHHNKYLKMK